MKGALDVLTTAPEYDLVVVTVGSSARFYPDLAVKPIIDSAGAAKPIAAFLVPEAPRCACAARGRGRAEFAHAWRPAPMRSRRRCGAARRGRPRCVQGRPSGTGRMLDELEACGLFDKLGVPHAPSVALDASITKAPALPFAYPVVVKALSEKIAHKSDVGGVVLNVRDDAALLAAISKNPASHQGGPRAGAADGLRPRRGADRLSHRSAMSGRP